MSSENKQGCLWLSIYFEHFKQVCMYWSLEHYHLEEVSSVKIEYRTRIQKSGSPLRKVIQNSPAHLLRRFILYFWIPSCLFCFIPMSLNLTRRNFSWWKKWSFSFSWMNYGDKWSLLSRNALIFGITEIHSCQSVKPVIRIIKNFAHSAKWHILLNNYSFLGVSQSKNLKQRGTI